MKNRTIYVLSIIAILLFVMLEIWWIRETDEPFLSKSDREQKILEQLNFELSDPELSPPLLRESVLRGYQIMNHTPELVKGYVSDSITCSNCHFAGGNTTGGKNNGIALVGVAARYPQFNDRFGKVITLEERIQSCFEKSMNGKKIPYDSSTMTDLVSYLTWISRSIPIYGKVSFPSLPKLKSPIQGDKLEGGKLYTTYCADCHGNKGEGKIEDTTTYPPLWGNTSFNRRAGLGEPEKLASFIYLNMPYNLPGLTEEQVIHIARYILSQERPGDR